MKLTGSSSEENWKKRLLESWQFFQENNQIMFVLKENFKEVKSAFQLWWGPDQEEDFFKILINGAYIVKIEVSKVGRPIVIHEIKSLTDYRRGLKGKTNLLRLLIALELAKNIDGKIE
jgi:hypothetical protein